MRPVKGRYGVPPDIPSPMTGDASTTETPRTAVEELGHDARFNVPMVVQRNRIERERAKFDMRSVTFPLDWTRRRTGSISRKWNPG